MDTATRLKVARIDEFADGSTRVVACPDGGAIAVFRTNGSFHAIDNVCPHRGGPLSEGGFSGGAVTCPLHGWRFDVATGECLDHAGQRVRVHRVLVEAADLFVEVRSVPAAPPDHRPNALVRFSVMGHVGKFAVDESLGCRRGSRVIVRTERGVEMGEILAAGVPDTRALNEQPASGDVLRLMTDADSAVAERIREAGQGAFDACRRLLEGRGVPIELIDAEQLFDGSAVIFYFLGEATPAMAEITNELAREFEAQVQFRPVGEPAAAACGTGCASGSGGCGEPNCGGGGCASGGCDATHDS